MKKIWKNNSKLLIIICLLQLILGIYFLMYFNYMDRLNYIESNKLVVDEYNIKISDDYIYLSNDIMCEFLGINYQIEKKNNK